MGSQEGGRGPWANVCFGCHGGLHKLKAGVNFVGSFECHQVTVWDKQEGELVAEASLITRSHLVA